MILPLMSPETFSNQMPLPPLPAISQSVTRMSRPPALKPKQLNLQEIHHSEARFPQRVP
jgi:hypothetical protein